MLCMKWVAVSQVWKMQGVVTLTNLKYLHATLAFYLHDTLSPTANIGRYEQRILVIGR